MPDAPDGGRRIGRVRVVLAAWAIFAAAIGIYIFRSPQQDGTRGRITRMARALGRLVGQEDRARKPIGVIIREIEQGDEAGRVQTILRSFELTDAELAQVFPHLIRAMKDESEMVRNAAATVVGDLSERLSGEASVAEEALTAPLDDPSPLLRARAVKSLGAIAASGRLDAPPPRLVACLDDADEFVRSSTTEALFEYRKGPERIVPVALRRLPTESKVARAAFTDLFWHVRLEPSVLPLLIEGLSSEDTEVRLICAAAINHMGREARPALPAIMTLIRMELETPHSPDLPEKHDKIIGMAAGAIGEVTSDAECPPGSVELLCEILRRRGEAIRGSAAAGLDSPAASAPFLGPEEELLAEAVWSLGILGRSAAPAVPLLLSTFESARRVSNLRGQTAEALAEISRGTPDEDRVLACLARAWETSPKEQKTAIARALRRLRPKSGQLVAGLRQWPADGTGSQRRRYRFPRSRRGFPEPQ
jgi:HEAT repeat protein